jgi:predicted PurR-regulated permease PerM
VPLQRLLEQRKVPASLASAMTVFIGIVAIMFPLLFVGERLIVEITHASAAFNRFLAGNDWQESLSRFSAGRRIISWVQSDTGFAEVGSTVAASLTGFVASIAQASGQQIIATLVSFYLLFFMLRDRRLIMTFVAHLIPIERLELTALNARIADTIRATILGTLLIAIIQGTLGGLMFWWLGLPSPLIWAIMMGIAGMVPMLGTFTIWLPTAIVLALGGDYGSALILMLWGVTVVSLIDNILYPVLVGARTQTHTVIAFISIVGGVLAFGPAGLILGPVLFTVAAYLIELWQTPENPSSPISALQSEVG